MLSRWQYAFKKEGWGVIAPDSLPAGFPAADSVELDLVEVCSPSCKTPEDLQGIIKKRKPAATLAFASPRNISGSQIVKFLEAGADDFIYSDTDERVIVAKLKAYLRRMTPEIASTISRAACRGGEIEIDRDRRAINIKAKHGKHTKLLNLTQKELDIFSMLVANETRVVSRKKMLDKLWGAAAVEVYSDCIDKHIETLRKKLGPFGRRIKSVYGSGYMFTEKSGA